MTDDDLRAIRNWGESVLREYAKTEGLGGTAGYLCSYMESLPTHSIRSQMLALVDEVERLQQALAGILAIVDSDATRWDRVEGGTDAPALIAARIMVHD